jgi:hypothetical protein
MLSIGKDTCWWTIFHLPLTFRKQSVTGIRPSCSLRDALEAISSADVIDTPDERLALLDPLHATLNAEPRPEAGPQPGITPYPFLERSYRKALFNVFMTEDGLRV